MRNKFLLMIAIVIAVVGVGIVTAQDDLSGVDPTGVTITYWHEWDGAQEEGIAEVIRLFEESNEFGITVDDVGQGGTGDLLGAVSAGIASGEFPNLSGGAFGDVAQDWFVAGVLVPLDVYYDDDTYGMSDDEQALMNPQMINISRSPLSPFDNQLLAWPIGVSGNIFSVSLTMMEELNAAGSIDFTGAPETFDQFRAAACGATELTTADGAAVNGYPISTSEFELYSFAFSNGGWVFDSDENRFDYTNDGFIGALQFLQDLFNDGCAYIPEGRFANTGDFSLGLNPFAVGSSVGVPFIQRPMDEAGLDIEWVNTTLPWVEGSRTIIPNPRGVAVLQGTPEQNLATWLFLKFWATNADAQVAWTQAAQYLPYNSETSGNLSDEFHANNPQFGTVADALADPDIRVMGRPDHPRASEIDDVVQEMYIDVILNGADPAEAAADAEELANEIYEEVLEDLADL